MKKIMLALLIVAGTFISAGASPAVDSKILEKFATAFPNAQNPSWKEYDNYVEVYFSNSDNSKCRIKYDKEGKIISSRRDYEGAMLSPFIQSKIKEKYAGKKVFGVTEICSDEGLTYHIVLEDEKHWYNIAADANGQLSLEKRLNKSK
jgi:hypothetical protein